MIPGCAISPEFLWHSHPGPVIVNVTKGELVYGDI
jgi:quercetin dioxygenase-like cupin family protein